MSTLEEDLAFAAANMRPALDIRCDPRLPENIERVARTEKWFNSMPHKLSDCFPKGINWKVFKYAPMRCRHREARND